MENTLQEQQCLEILQQKFGRGKLWRGTQVRTNTTGWHFQIGYDNTVTSMFLGVRLSVKKCVELKADGK